MTTETALALRERLQLRRLPEPSELRRIRAAAGLTQVEVASHLGVSPVTVARWEAGTRHARGGLAEDYGRLLRDLERASA